MAPRPPPVIRINGATFYRHHPNSHTSHPNPPLFSDLNYELPSEATPNNPPTWCVLGPSLSGKTSFLQVLQGQHIALPPTARSFPYLSTPAVRPHLRNTSKAIRYVGFSAESSGLGPATTAYLSARYESRREKTDFSLRDFLLGNTQLNPYHPDPASSEGENSVSQTLFDRVVDGIKLMPLLDLPVAFLSNGQGRRARIARALLTSPEVLLLDEPFMGLDPPTVRGLSPLLRDMAEKAAPRLVLSARPQDALPDWITHLVYLRTDCQVGFMGPRQTVMEKLETYVLGVRKGKVREDARMPVQALTEMGRTLTEKGVQGSGFGESESFQVSHGKTSSPPPTGKALVEMEGCRVRYGDKIALGNWSQPATTSSSSSSSRDGLYWTVREGECWGVFGPNGSGKTTIVSLLCSDHPQTYSLPIRLFGRTRLPEPGGPPPLTFWDVQSRVGHSSPEVHQHMPRRLTVRQVVENAWADTFQMPPRLPSGAREKVDACLRWFERELNPSPTSSFSSSSLAWADAYLFGELPFSAQRVALFLRAVVKNPPIVVLDEAFSGMDETVRDKCALFLAHGQAKRLEDGGSVTVEQDEEILVGGLSPQQALICIAHVKEEVPDVVREWMCLPEANSGQPARFGRLRGPLKRDRAGWEEIWGL